MRRSQWLYASLLLTAACSAAAPDPGLLDPSSDADAGAAGAPGLPGPGTTTIPADAGSSARDAMPPPASDAAPPTGRDGGGTPPPSPPPPAPAPAPPGSDAGPGSPDGPPTRLQCTGSLGSSLSSQHARLDGYVVAVIAPGQGKQCNGDSSHVHLQVRMNNQIYDVAANVDGQMTTRDAPLLAGPWAEGWHTADALNYPTDLGAHSADFTMTGTNAVASAVENELAQANHVSIFCTGYGPDGCHLVHRQGTGRDGAIVINPLSPTARWLLFDFTGDGF